MRLTNPRSTPLSPVRPRPGSTRARRGRALAVAALAASLTLAGCGSTKVADKADDAAASTTPSATAEAAPAPVAGVPARAAGHLSGATGHRIAVQVQEARARAAARKAARKAAAQAAVAAASNPLAGRPWGVYKGPQDQAWGPYENASGSTKDLLGYIALKPRTKWFGGWVGSGQITETVRSYVSNAQAGNSSALVQMAVFRMQPWEHEACGRAPSDAEDRDYRAWIDNFARGIGDAHVALILQPDGPFALCVPNRAKSSAMVAYSAKVFSSLPHTSVYIDGGAADWPAVGQGGTAKAVEFLIPAGIKYARGVALNSTHYSDTRLEVQRGADIVRSLAAKGIPGKKVVVNTANSGNPFVFGDYRGGDPDNAIVCSSPNDSRNCVTLGVPPTTDVGNPKWGLGSSTEALAREYVDAYLWFGRPWLVRQNDPFDMQRALQLVRSTPFR